MAVYSPNPYSAGAVVFNQAPWEAFYERQAAKKQAKEDALNSYFKDLNKNITTAGMRSQDVPQLLQKNKEWQDLYAQNKSAILNPKLDNGKAYSDYNRLYQEQQAVINESKDAHKAMDEIGKMKLNPQMSYVFDDPHFMEQVQKHELPIGDPNRQGINLASISLPPQPVTTKDLKAYQDYLTGGVQFDKIPGQTETLPGFKTRTPIYTQYGVKSQLQIGQHAMNAYDTDPKWRREAVKYFDEIQNNPEEYKKVNELHQQLYGRPIDDPREAWAAKGILDNQMKAITYLPGIDTYGQSVALARIQHKYRMSEMEAKEKMKNKSDDVQNSVIDNLYDNLKMDAINNKVKYEPSEGAPFDQYEMKASGTIKKMYGMPDGQGHIIYPDVFRYSKDFKTVTPIFFEHYTDDKGKRLPEIVKDKKGRSQVIKELSKPVLEPEFKERWKKELMGAQAYGKQISKGAKPNIDTDPAGIF